jgi:hypothetical protein
MRKREKHRSETGVESPYPMRNMRPDGGAREWRMDKDDETGGSDNAATG